MCIFGCEFYNNDDFISVFSQEYDEQIFESAKQKLLLESPLDSELEDGRYFLFVYPMCADLGCGAVKVRIQQEQEMVVWSDFRYENHQTSRTAIKSTSWKMRSSKNSETAPQTFYPCCSSPISMRRLTRTPKSMPICCIRPFFTKALRSQARPCIPLNTKRRFA